MLCLSYPILYHETADLSRKIYWIGIAVDGITVTVVTVQVGDGDTVGNFLKEVSHTLQELSKHVLCTVRSIILSYFCYRFSGDPALLSPKIAKTPSRGPLSPLYGEKGERTVGGGKPQSVQVCGQCPLYHEKGAHFPHAPFSVFHFTLNAATASGSGVT